MVYEKVHRNLVEVIAPAFGRRRVSLATCSKLFIGVARVLDMDAGTTLSQPSVKSEPTLLRELEPALLHAGHWHRVLALSLCLQLLMLALPSLTGVIIDAVVPRGADHRLLILAIGFVLLAVFFCLVSLLRSHLLLHRRSR